MKVQDLLFIKHHIWPYHYHCWRWCIRTSGSISKWWHYRHKKKLALFPGHVGGEERRGLVSTVCTFALMIHMNWLREPYKYTYQKWLRMYKQLSPGCFRSFHAAWEWGYKTIHRLKVYRNQNSSPSFWAARYVRSWHEYHVCNICTTIDTQTRSFKIVLWLRVSQCNDIFRSSSSLQATCSRVTLWVEWKAE